MIEAMSDIEKSNTSEISKISNMYPNKTFDEYISMNASITRLGSYEYIEFYRQMRDPCFYKNIKSLYNKEKQLNQIRYDIIVYILGVMKKLPNSSIEIHLIEYIDKVPLYEYISKNIIDLDEEPLVKNFRNNKAQFYEIYTLWNIHKF